MTRRPRESASVDRLTAAFVKAYNEGFRKMTAILSDVLAATTALQTSVDENTAATKAAIAAGIGSAASPPVDLQPAVDAVNTAKAAVDASTAALTAATGSPAGVPGAISVSPTSISGSVGTPFSTQLSASGGNGSYTFATSDSFVNTGASLNSDGTVNAASVAGTDTVNVVATDSTGATGTTAVTVSAA